jgi:hypothetical protein
MVPLLTSTPAQGGPGTLTFRLWGRVMPVVRPGNNWPSRVA